MKGWSASKSVGQSCHQRDFIRFKDDWLQRPILSVIIFDNVSLSENGIGKSVMVSLKYKTHIRHKHPL
jgi:hypothetical protein